MSYLNHCLSGFLLYTVKFNPKKYNFDGENAVHKHSGFSNGILGKKKKNLKNCSISKIKTYKKMTNCFTT